MYEFKAHNFVQLAQLLTVIEEYCAGHGDKLFTDDTLAVFQEQLETATTHCREISGLDTSILCMTEMREWLNERHRRYGDVGPKVGVLRDTIRRELQAKVSFTLSALEADHYVNFREGWENVIARFPDVLSDLEEARKCFALNRYAASVFHSTQIVEITLIELGRFIKVKDPRSGWTAVTGTLHRIIGKPYKDRTRFERKYFEFLEQVHGTVAALKDAWRNKVSHAQGRLILLTTDFTPGITEEILFATRGFTSRLAHGLP